MKTNPFNAALIELSLTEKTTISGGEFVVPIAMGGGINPFTGQPYAVLYPSGIQLPTNKVFGSGIIGHTF